ncbi:MAG: hypothetical protein GF310_12555 [candidate division Zixibacteria bacterium]|nr:hypothetical protein [candidate division Zixibacteria bacterium]
MKLYFFGKCSSAFNDQPGGGIISIMMPDLGMMYRTQFEGSQKECEYTAAIMAMKFVEKNKELLCKQKIQILTDASGLIEEINHDAPVSPGNKIYRDTVLMYLKKFGMALSWVPRSENRAAGLVPDLPPLKLKLDLDFDFGQKGNDSALGTNNGGNGIF